MRSLDPYEIAARVADARNEALIREAEAHRTGRGALNARGMQIAELAQLAAEIARDIRAEGRARRAGAAQGSESDG
jgi:hypothetical protein